MKWSRVKTILIYLLLGVNVAFGINLAGIYAENKKTRMLAVDDAMNILAAKGIKAERDSVPDGYDEYEVRITRDPERESQCAQQLLGEHKTERPDDDTVRYKSDSGQITFKNGGFFEIILTEEQQIPENEEQAEKLAAQIMEAAGFKMRGADLKSAEADGGCTVEINSSGKPRIYGNGARAEFSGDGVRVYGRWANYEKKSGGDRAKSEWELLLKLSEILDVVAQTADDPAKIETGYMIRQQGSQTCLTPVWRVEYGQNTEYLNAITGQPEELE